ncbi:MAG: hypothetical protein EHJ95_04515, partial [Methanobacteriota archaeon]
MQSKTNTRSRLVRNAVLGLSVLALRLGPLPAGIISYLDSGLAKMNDSGSVAFAAQVDDKQGTTGGLFLNVADGRTIPVALRGLDFPVAGHSFVRLIRSDFAVNNQNDILFAAEMRNDENDSRSGAVLLYLHSERQLITVLAPVDLKPETDPRSLVRVGLDGSGHAAFAITVGGEDRLYSYEVSTKSLTILAKDGDVAPGGGT